MGTESIRARTPSLSVHEIEDDIRQYSRSDSAYVRRHGALQCEPRHMTILSVDGAPKDLVMQSSTRQVAPGSLTLGMTSVINMVHHGGSFYSLVVVFRH
jgi:hypothetical protein